jgi:glycine/D-amino acid oxidase-like deaminating enzyme
MPQQIKKEQNGMKSIWNREILPEYPALKEDHRCEVLVIGGGLTGLLLARKLTDAGVRCTVAEADRIFSGVSKNTTAKITAQHGMVYADLLRRLGRERTAAYLHANLAATEEYRRHAEKYDIGFREAPSAVYLLRDGERRLEAEQKALSELGYKASLKRETELPFRVAGALFFSDQAVCDPVRLAASLLPGLNVYEKTRVRELRGSLAMTESGRIRADRIVVATHFPYLNKHGLYPLKMYQSRSFVLALRNAFLPDGTYIDGSGEGFSFRRQDDLLLLGGGDRRTGKSGGGWRPLELFCQKHFPSAKIEARFAAEDCITLDGLPYVGQYGRFTPDLYVATGFGKWGLTNSMVAATLLTDLLTGKENRLASVLSPMRRMPLLAALKNGVTDLGNILSPGKRCPHLGCALKWNPDEHSWDCPCHGSRFSESGKLLDGPATGDLPSAKR